MPCSIAACNDPSRRTKIVVALLQIITGLLLVLFLLILYRRHAGLQIRLDNESKRPPFSLLPDPLALTQPNVMIKGVDDVELGEDPTYNVTDSWYNGTGTGTDSNGAADEAGGQEESVYSVFSSTAFIVGECFAIAIGVAFVGLIVYGLFVNKTCPINTRNRQGGAPGNRGEGAGEKEKEGAGEREGEGEGPGDSGVINPACLANIVDEGKNHSQSQSQEDAEEDQEEFVMEMVVVERPKLDDEEQLDSQC